MIPWDEIPEEYEWCAIDGGGGYKGDAWLFTTKPSQNERGAWEGSTLIALHRVIDIKEVSEYMSTPPEKSLIYRYDYEESATMETDRGSIKEDIRKRLVKIKGIGPEKAERGSDAVMEYLDGLVSSQQETPCNLVPGRRDTDGTEMIKRPPDIHDKYNYLYWEYSSEITMGWLHPEKPLYSNLGFNHYTCEGLDEEEEGYVTLDQLYDILGEARVESEPSSDRIVRLVD